MRDNHITRSNEELYAIEKKWTNKVMANIKFVKQCHQKKKKNESGKWKIKVKLTSTFRASIELYKIYQPVCSNTLPSQTCFPR